VSNSTWWWTELVQAAMNCAVLMDRGNEETRARE